MDDKLIIGGRSFGSRLLLGTGKFPSAGAMVDAIGASGSEIVTVALRRVDLADPADELTRPLESTGVLLLPNTSGARDAEEAVRLARLARAGGCEPWVKLEVTPDPHWLLPDPIETLRAAEILAAEGFNVLPYMNADPVLAKRLEDVGVAAVMPLGAPIGTNKGITTREQVAIIIESASVPVIVDAGLGAPSHAAAAMEMGADAVLVNTAIAVAADPAAMARAFAKGVQAGREAYIAGLAPQREGAEASSPLFGLLGA